MNLFKATSVAALASFVQTAYAQDTTAAATTEAAATEAGTTAAAATTEAAPTTTRAPYVFGNANEDCEDFVIITDNMMESEVVTDKYCGKCHDTMNVTNFDTSMCLPYGIPDYETSVWEGEWKNGPEAENYVDEHKLLTECDCMQKCTDNSLCMHAVWYGDDMWFEIKADLDQDGVIEPRFINAPARCMLVLDGTCEPNHAGGRWTLWHKATVVVAAEKINYGDLAASRSWDSVEDAASSLSAASVAALLLGAALLRQ